MANAFTFNSAASSSAFTFNAPSTPSPFSQSARKRARDSAAHLYNGNGITPLTQRTDWNLSEASSVARSADAGSPAPLADTRYVFAGGISTLSGEEDMGERYDCGDQAGLAQYRRRWTEEQGPLDTPGEDERTGKRKLDSAMNEQESPGWGRFVFNLVGGVAGKMWDFCRGAAFKGFHAGGGRAYDTNMKPVDREQHNMQMGESVWEDLDSRQSYSASNRSPLPGQFPEEQQKTFTFQQDNDITPPRPAKRLHTETGSGWVMVSHNLEKPDSRVSSPRPSSYRNSFSNSPSHIPRPVSQQRPPSSAGARRSLLPRRSSGVSFSGSPTPRSSLPSFTARPSYTTRERQYTRQSYDAPALVSPPKKGSPLSPEVQRYAARLRREEIEADASMSRLSAQLNALIKEGQAALQSRVDVEYKDDEGFAEGKW